MTGPVHHFEELYGADLHAAPSNVVRPFPTPAGAPPRVCVVYNPRSHRNKGQDLTVAGLPNVKVGLPHGREQITETLAGFARDGVDYLIINGGDGTVRDVLTCGQAVFGDHWPDLAVLPKGKTNALNVDLGAPRSWTLEQAIEAYASGRRVLRRPLAIKRADGQGPTVRGFIFGAGVFSIAIRVGQGAHRMGAFDSLAVGATAVWGCLQALFGSDDNAWRRGNEMAVTLLPGGTPMPHSRFGHPARRTILLASTLERLPLGIKLFGPDRPGLKLTALDHPRRRIIALVPAILAGWAPRWLGEGGFHQLDAEAFEIALGDSFILDGEAFPAGAYRVSQGAALSFVVP